VQVGFTAWTRENLIRQSSFLGIREDKIAQEVTQEVQKAEDDCRDCPPTSAVQATPPHPNRKSAGQPLSGVRITHPGKVIDPDSGATKQQVAEYYSAIADHLLPHIVDRPLSIVRCPDGIGKPCFFQKHLTQSLPAGVSNVNIPKRKTGELEEFLVVQNVEGLLGLAQLGVLEIHPWGSTAHSVENADRLIFDLDPDETLSWNTLASAAEEMRAYLKQFGLISFVKSTGGKGLHVVAPIQPDYEWPIIKQFAQAVAIQLQKSNPRLYLTTMSKAARKNKIYLDYLRNGRGSTAIGPYSTRARPGFPVAVPLDWKELSTSIRPTFHISDFDSWRARLRRDPWQPMLRSKQKLESNVIRELGVRI
jgi:bifunctional non-homologous end joining protein LigD